MGSDDAKIDHEHNPFSLVAVMWGGRRMTAAVLVFLIPTVLLSIAGGLTIWGAATRMRNGLLRRAAGVVRSVGGVGTLVFAVLALAPLWSDMQYGIVILPVAALVGALLWNVLLFGIAALIQHGDRSTAPK